MDDPLKRLLAAEARARQVLDVAHAERQRRMAEALAAVHESEQRFEARRAELRAPLLDEARIRADQAVAELTRKYAGHHRQLRDLASRHGDETVAAALDLLLDPGL